MYHNLGYKNTPVRLRRSFFFCRTDAVFATSTTDRGIFIPQRYYLWTNLSGWRWRKSKIISGYMECRSLKSMVLKWERYLIPISSKPSISDKASRVTTSNSGNFKVLCNISLTNYVPSAFNQIRHHIIYVSFISNPDIRFLQIKASRVTTSNSGNFRVICNISLTNFITSASSHIRHQTYIIHIKSSYQIPPNQGFQGHYFKLKLLQDQFLSLSIHRNLSNLHNTIPELVSLNW